MSDQAAAASRQSAAMPSPALSFVQARQTERAVDLNVQLLSAHERTQEASAP